VGTPISWTLRFLRICVRGTTRPYRAQLSPWNLIGRRMHVIRRVGRSNWRMPTASRAFMRLIDETASSRKLTIAIAHACTLLPDAAAAAAGLRYNSRRLRGAALDDRLLQVLHFPTLKTTRSGHAAAWRRGTNYVVWEVLILSEWVEFQRRLSMQSIALVSNNYIRNNREKIHYSKLAALIRLNIVKSTLVSTCPVFCGPNACKSLKLSLVCTCLVNEIVCLPCHAVQLPPRRRSYVCIYYSCVYVYICIFVYVSVYVYVCVCVFFATTVWWN